MLAAQKCSSPRRLIYKTSGYSHGPICRLMSPSDLGQLIKPFVFLDLAEFGPRYAPMGLETGWHPHSGIATLTVILDGTIRFQETTGRDGALPKGGIEWMRAGNGVWHTGSVEPGHAKAFQLWVALPPELENAPNASQYLVAKDVPEQGPVRVILGEYSGQKSGILAPPMNYLHVTLSPGERWTYAPPKGHDVAWVAVHEGALTTPEPVREGEIAVFEHSEAPIEFRAVGKTGFVLGSAARHPHELVLGTYSVHTSAQALNQGDGEIRRVGRELVAGGKRSYALREYT
jgi:redox-sensitive bicupin YhaK (pirin superfamily)